MDPLLMAIFCLGCPREALQHSDPGSQYMSRVSINCSNPTASFATLVVAVLLEQPCNGKLPLDA